MSAAAADLSIIQARAEFVPVLRRVQAAAEPSSSGPSPRPQLAFYRKYTEAMLRRYLRMSLEVGRVPSLLGREMFRAKVSSYRMESFEDVVIFCHDVERCIQRLTDNDQFMIGQIALKQYTIGETSETLGIDPRTVIRRYSHAVDRLTGVFLEVKLLELQN
jgi:hypothetical protein